jgi:hypothetical protein
MSAEPAAAPAESTPGMPDFFIVGHAKCGTTALYEMLRQHPQIYMPDYKRGAGKEPWYFSRDNPQPQLSAERSVAFTGRRAMSPQEYLSLFSGAQPGQLTGEASTSYLWSPVAAARIAQARPDARIVAILREPASFLRSLHLQLLQNQVEVERDLRTALSLDQPRREGRMIPPRTYWPAALIYSDRVRYVEQLRRYEEVFPREQILVLIYDDWRSDNRATVRSVLRFLDVDEDADLRPADVNPTKLGRTGALAKVTRAVRAESGPVAKTSRRAYQTLMSSRVRDALAPVRRRLLWTAPEPADRELMAEIRARYKGEVEAISEHLGRDLVKLWGYDDVP